MARATWVWLGLLLATLASVVIVEAASGARAAATAALALAFGKSRVVIAEYMELRRAPLALRLAGELWPIALGGTLIALFLG